MSAVTRKLADLRDKIIAKIDKKFSEFKSNFTTEINGQMKLMKLLEQEQLESTVAVLQQHVKNFQKQMMVLHSTVW